ncbi:helix-turn-helix domain-containing protein [Paenibacillus sp. Y412MC10]|uniref:helix-turn-helix domain-containing protein n=1 Tax=Geobacillus sp. (strain Y412MC10) TaxID=481743 RepID=UPI0011A06F1F|nr:helix-turn-helix domain-containing protein [Paenibacillus sp. Y412MC10]
MDNLRLKSSYKPFQPDLEQKCIVNRFKVQKNDILYGKIWDMYEYEISSSRIDSITILPDGLIELLFNFSDSNVNSYFALASTETKSVNINRSGKGFGIKFVPGWLGQIQHAPLSRSRHTQDSITYIESAEIIADFDSLFQQIISTESFEERVHHCRNFFGGIDIIENHQSELARQACLYLINHNGIKTIGDLESYMGYGSRYIRKLFDDYIGYSPKKMNEIIKFQHSFYHYYIDPARSLSDLACEFGYYDLSHMNRAYTKFSQKLPKMLYKNLFVSNKGIL